jgi:hypothetical protein
MHIAEVHSLSVNFSSGNFYNVAIENEPETGANFLCFDINTSGFPFDDAAVGIGDAVHNLRSSLDHLYYQVVLCCGGTPTQWTRFPIYDLKDRLQTHLNGALKHKQISDAVATLILNRIRPYQTGDRNISGNRNIWGIHDLNIRDKHKVLTPIIKLTGIWDIRIEDENHTQFGSGEYFISNSCRIRLSDADDRIVTLKNKGHGLAFIIFDEGMPLKGQPVIATLRNMSREVTRTIEAFASLLSLKSART